MTRPVMTIILGPELWDNELVATLVGLGHTVRCLQDEAATVIISRSAWRIPAGVPKEELPKHVDMILKQVRALTHEDQSPIPAPKRANKKPKKPAGGELPVEGEGGEARSAAQGEGQLGGDTKSITDHGKPARKRKGVKDESTEGC